MDWMVMNSQFHATFALLGTRVGDTYHVNEGFLDILNDIFNKLSTEDCVFRTFRRAIGFSQVIKKDLLPLLCSAKDDSKTFNTVVKILGNLTVPVECLMDIDVLLKTDSGRTIIYELNWLLTSCKEAFLDPRVTRAILDFIKVILDKEESLTGEDCESVNNCLLLLRNILHIPEVRGGVPGNGISHQNQIVWNMFTQNMDKVLIQLITETHQAYWGMAVVQLVALIYKDQHVSTLQKLLNIWFEASISESSEDNESNTSPPDQGSGDSSSSMIMSDPTSDSSDNGRSSERQHKHPKPEVSDNSSSGYSSSKTYTDNKQIFNTNWISDSGRKHLSGNRKHSSNTKSQNKKDRTDPLDNSHFEIKSHHSTWSWTSTESTSAFSCKSNTPRKNINSEEVSDCGYGTQVDNQESISTSSNEDEMPNQMVKPVHLKPSYLMQKTRYPARKVVKLQEKKELRRKKLIKRSKTNTMNMKALLHHKPSDEDISHLLKEFTVDFLLKGYSHLVQVLQAHLLMTPDVHTHVDTSHFFWLVTYFLKFASQLELDLEHISPVLSYQTVSYLTFEGANLSERLELLRLEHHSDLTPCLRRLHLVVTALREVIQALEIYKKISHLSKEDEICLVALQDQIFSSDDLRSLFILLLRQFDPTIQSKQYLQDIIITNHNLLIFLENYSKSSSFVQANFQQTSMDNHIRQFATINIMKQYGLLLEYFEENGEFVNNCIFTMMHHVAGDMDQVHTLFQPSILKTYFKIWESEFEICDDWSDLIEYVVHKFINLQHKLPVPSVPDDQNKLNKHDSEDDASTIGKTEESRKLLRNNSGVAASSDHVDVLSHYTEKGDVNKTRLGVIRQFLRQDILQISHFDGFVKKDQSYNDMLQTLGEKSSSQTKENRVLDEIDDLIDCLVQNNKGRFIAWLKKCLLETCYAKLSLAHKRKLNVEPIPYHYALLQQSIPLVSWTSEQQDILQYQPFLLLLNKLGLHLPSDTGKVYARIPHFWTADILYTVAQKLSPTTTEELKFDVGLLEVNSNIPWITDQEIITKSFPSTQFKVSTLKQLPTFISFTPGIQENKDGKKKIDADLMQMCVSDEDPVSSTETT